jgi:hypothetical protein
MEGATARGQLSCRTRGELSWLRLQFHGSCLRLSDPDDDLADDECADPEDRPGQVEVARRAFPPCSRYK